VNVTVVPDQPDRPHPPWADQPPLQWHEQRHLLDQLADYVESHPDLAELLARIDPRAFVTEPGLRQEETPPSCCDAGPPSRRC
jgi:hypothetical protein